MNQALSLPFLCAIFIVGFFISCGVKPPLEEAGLRWINPLEHDFGSIPHKEPIEHQFKFINQGNIDLEIDNVRASCGCTAPNWEEKLIPPGDTGIIRVTYDARDTGFFFKTVKVYFSRISGFEVLSLEGEVLKSEGEE